MAAAEFIGMTVLVRLKEPPDTVIQGLVGDVVGQTLFLHHVFFPLTGHRFPQYNIDGSHIADLELIPQDTSSPESQRQNLHIPPEPRHDPSPLPPHQPPQNNVPMPHQQLRIGSILVSPPSRQGSLVEGPPQSHMGNVSSHPQSAPPMNMPPPGPPPPTQPHNRHQKYPTPPPPYHPSVAVQEPMQQTRSGSFLDPAILSVGRPSATVPEPSPQMLQEAPSTPVKLMESAVKAAIPPNTSPFVGVANAKAAGAIRLSTSDAMLKGRKVKDSSATLSAPFSGLGSARDGFGNGFETKDQAELQEDTDEVAIRGGVRRVSISKTRSGLPMDTPTRAVENGRKKGRGKRGRKKGQSTQSFHHDQDSSPEAVRKSNSANGDLNAEGWRQTPIIQDDQGPFSRHAKAAKGPGIIGGKAAREAATSTKTKGSMKKTRNQRALEQTERRSGWATEDATDIQEMPEFDFAGNLSKFDKRSVFDAIRNEDTTADEERLVSYNRAGVRNLLPTENVLDGAVAARKSAATTNRAAAVRSSSLSDNSFDDSLDDEVSDLESARGSRRARSRTSAPLQQALRSNSGLSRPSQAQTMYASSSHAAAGGSPSLGAHATPPISPPYDAPHHPHAHPHAQAAASLAAATGTTARSSVSAKPKKPTLRIAGTGRPAPTLSPRGLSALEVASCRAPFHLTTDILAETAGRGIAQVALGAINPGGRRLSRDTLRLNGRPVVVVLAGRTRAGARALVAARGLTARGVRVMCAVVGVELPEDGEECLEDDDYDNDDDDEEVGASNDDDNNVNGDGSVVLQLDDRAEVRRALRHEALRVRGAGGLVGTWERVRAELRRLERPPELIVDALLGPGFDYERLGARDRGLAREVVGWANQSRAAVLAVEGPSGVDGVTGATHMLEGEPFEVRARYVVCLGAPRVGLLRALQTGEGAGWLLWLVDTGIGRAWRRRQGSKRVRFGAEWVAGLIFE